jgi:glycosyltransferase involved in cell wall biosynthesis
MRIFYFARIDIEADDAGARHVLETCKQFASMGHETFLFVPNLGITRKLPGVSIVKVPVFIRKPAFTYFSFHAILFFYLLYHCLTNKPDVVYTRQQTLEWWATWLKVIFRFRYAIEVNGLPLIELKMSHASWWITAVTRIMEWICYRFPDLWVVPTTHIKYYLCKEYRLDPKQFLVVSNGANADIFHPMDQISCRNQLELDSNVKYLLFMGGFKKWHGILELIEIMTDLIHSDANIKLLLVGDGELISELRARVDVLGLKESVIFCGRRPLAQMPAFINAADICLAPFFDERSPYTGLSPLKLFEYMSCGKPVIASGLGGLDEVFESHDIGEVVSSSDPKKWTPVILSLLNNPDRMKSCGENGRRAVLEKFNWKSISENILNHLAGN